MLDEIALQDGREREFGKCFHSDLERRISESDYRKERRGCGLTSINL
jgi:hypothetical protein